MTTDQNNHDVLLVDTREVAGVLVEVWTINREKNLNALNSAILKRVGAQCKIFKKNFLNNKKGAVVLKGAGEKAFAAGADIVEMKDLNNVEAKAFSELGHKAFGELESLPVPTIAAVDGFALGGGLELAMSCDLIFASPKSKFGQPEATLGLIPGFGATARFVERMGRAKALEFFYSSAMLSADEALRFGLIERVSSDEQSSLDLALKYLEGVFKKNSPLAISKVKEVCSALYTKRIHETCALEAKAFGDLFESADKKEGVEAFLAKRPAQFLGE